jgi:hypothetical protein
MPLYAVLLNPKGALSSAILRMDPFWENPFRALGRKQKKGNHFYLTFPLLL